MSEPVTDINGVPFTAVRVENRCAFDRLPTELYAYVDDPWHGRPAETTVALFPTLRGLRTRFRQYLRWCRDHRATAQVDNQMMLRGTITWEKISAEDVNPDGKF